LIFFKEGTMDSKEFQDKVLQGLTDLNAGQQAIFRCLDKRDRIVEERLEFRAQAVLPAAIEEVPREEEE